MGEGVYGIRKAFKCFFRSFFCWYYDFIVPLHYRLISFYRKDGDIIYGERRFRTFVFVEHELRNFKPHNRQMDNGNVYVVRLSYLQMLIEMISPF